jgi:hypothetical protein
MRLIGILVSGVERQIANALSDSDYYPEVGMWEAFFPHATGNARKADNPDITARRPGSGPDPA